MRENVERLTSADGKLILEARILRPSGEVRGVVQISHGMTEHKGRYLPFQQFLAKHGYASIIHDHRGHGASVLTPADYGYFYDDTGEEIVRDLYAVTEIVKEEFPGVPLYLFAHSMGTLVVRCYLQTHADEVQRVILCGAPYKNDASRAGLALVNQMSHRRTDRYRLKQFDKMLFGGFSRRFGESKQKNRWLCSVSDEVERYNEDELCGFTFTLNGYRNLFLLMQHCYDGSRYNQQNTALPILFLAGGDDPVVGGGDKLFEQLNFFHDLGYRNVSGKVYAGRRHELLNEDCKHKVYRDVLRFLEE